MLNMFSLGWEGGLFQMKIEKGGVSCLALQAIKLEKGQNF